MEQQLTLYFKFITQKLNELSLNSSRSEIQHLLDLHLSQIQAFQHERLIHLLVTFFFGLLFLTFMLCVYLWPLWQFFALDVLLVILLGFYIKHYFFLENTLQKLYPITIQLFERLNQA